MPKACSARLLELAPLVHWLSGRLLAESLRISRSRLWDQKSSLSMSVDRFVRRIATASSNALLYQCVSCLAYLQLCSRFVQCEFWETGIMGFRASRLTQDHQRAVLGSLQYSILF